MSKDCVESEIILARMEEICPNELVVNKSVDELMKDVNVSFKIIGYEPSNLEKATKQALDKIGHKGELYRLCYNAWRLDDE